MILGLVCSFIERTFMATPSYIHVATELGYFFILKNQVKEALLWYTEAMKLDKDGMAGLTGICRQGRVRGWVSGAKPGSFHGSRREVLESILLGEYVNFGVRCMMGYLSGNPQVWM